VNTYIDDYCERLAPGLWAEPLNAITNLAFLLAAWCTWRLARQQNRLSGGPILLISLMAAIGIGSGLFHTVATRATQLMDVIPIGLFQAAFLWLYLRRIVQARVEIAAVLMLLFLVGGWLTGQFPHVLNGSLGYAPALVFVGGLGAWHYQQKKLEPYALLLATLLFVLSLLFRSIDNAVCPQFSIGTHFLWHLLNAAVLYLSMRGMLANYPRPA
jgi:hypothetical protein